MTQWISLDLICCASGFLLGQARIYGPTPPPFVTREIWEQPGAWGDLGSGILPKSAILTFQLYRDHVTGKPYYLSTSPWELGRPVQDTSLRAL